MKIGVRLHKGEGDGGREYDTEKGREREREGSKEKVGGVIILDANPFIMKLLLLFVFCQSQALPRISVSMALLGSLLFK